MPTTEFDHRGKKKRTKVFITAAAAAVATFLGLMSFPEAMKGGVEEGRIGGDSP